jgi:hypothetical protein
VVFGARNTGLARISLEIVGRRRDALAPVDLVLEILSRADPIGGFEVDQYVSSGQAR